MRFLSLLLLAVWTASPVSSFASTPVASTRMPSPRTNTFLRAEEEDAEPLPTPTNQVVSRVAVAGATGRTGRLVVQELLDRNVEVLALVRDSDKATEVFSSKKDKSLEIQVCDLTNEKQIQKTLQGCDAAIWCATGFSDAQTSIVERLKRLAGIALKPKQSIDAVGIPAIAKLFPAVPNGGNDGLPKVVMMSSAGVTRPSWDDDKKETFSGSAGIPIVRLNPFGILGVKADSEEKLRKSGSNYCIVRPAGLNDNWPSGSRPILSQGDIAVGRISRKDVATLLVDVLSQPEACGKTFEAIAAADYPPARNLASILARLRKDTDKPMTEGELVVAYSIMQQLLPGERQDAAALAMGQTYEQLDKGETGRMGKKGTEDPERQAGLQPTSS